jgi:transposase
MGRQGRLRLDDGRSGGRGGRSEDSDNRCHLSEGTPHGDQPAVEKGGADDQKGRLIGRTKGGMNTKLHAVTEAESRPIRFFMTAGQISDYTGAAALLDSLPKANWLLADRGYDADWFREALEDKGIKSCIPGRKSRGKPIKHDKRRYKRRNRSRSCSGGSRIGGGLQPATSGARRSSSPPSRSLQLSCSGYETRTSPDPKLLTAPACQFGLCCSKPRRGVDSHGRRGAADGCRRGSSVQRRPWPAIRLHSNKPVFRPTDVELTFTNGGFRGG